MPPIGHSCKVHVVFGAFVPFELKTSPLFSVSCIYFRVLQQPITDTMLINKSPNRRGAAGFCLQYTELSFILVSLQECDEEAVST